VRGSTSRLLESNPALSVEYIEDFCKLRRVADAMAAHVGPSETSAPVVEFRPSQWSSVVLQLDLLLSERSADRVSISTLVKRLVDEHAVPNEDRAQDLIVQAANQGILVVDAEQGTVMPNVSNAIVETTRLIRDRIVHRVANTLHVRGWEYVNYGFLLKGIGMDHGLVGPGLNTTDAWRSEWVDTLVREGILSRELVPHRHNPEDLVPVIKLVDTEKPTGAPQLPGVTREDVEQMIRRIIVSVEQFTSFRGFAWCPLGSLHRRLRPFDPSTTFQQAVEELLERGAVEINEYENPQSEFTTKGISLVAQSPIVQRVLEERNAFVRALLDLYERRLPLSRDTIRDYTDLSDRDLELWLSIMQSENVLKAVPGQTDLYSLFRTHHTVCMVAGDPPAEPPA